MESIDQFVRKWDSKLINNGGVQCPAVFNQYENEVIHGGWIGTPVTGYADDLWTQFGTDSDYNNYIRVEADKPAQKGDIAIWYHYNKGNNKPHVALVISNDNGSNSLNCFTQNPGNAHVELLTKDGLAGYLRPKKFVVAESAPAPVLTQPSRQTTHYELKVSVAGYVSSNDAANHINSNSTVPAGLYPIYNQAIGMINLTNQEGTPGWWINPSDNVVAAPVAAPVINTSNYKNSDGSFTVNHEVPGYMTADEAMSGQSSNSTVPTGTFAIFNEWHGAINVTRQAGVPGWWLNPSA
jgi:hypothetical protein